MYARPGSVLFLLAAAAALLGGAGGCATREHQGVMPDGRPWRERVADTVSDEHIDTLRRELLALGEGVSPDEAALLADVAVRHAAALAESYDMVRPIELHNMLVNVGLRKRGLCYQCAEDMYVKVRSLNLKTIDLHWGCADHGDLWLEHSSVIVTARGRPFAEGMVLDPWRFEGRLRWALVAEDRYPWEKRFKPSLERLPTPAGPPDPPRHAGGGTPRNDEADADDGTASAASAEIPRRTEPARADEGS